MLVVLTGDCGGERRIQLWVYSMAVQGAPVAHPAEDGGQRQRRVARHVKQGRNLAMVIAIYLLVMTNNQLPVHAPRPAPSASRTSPDGPMGPSVHSFQPSHLTTDAHGCALTTLRPRDENHNCLFLLTLHYRPLKPDLSLLKSLPTGLSCIPSCCTPAYCVLRLTWYSCDHAAPSQTCG